MEREKLLEKAGLSITPSCLLALGAARHKNTDLRILTL